MKTETPISKDFFSSRWAFLLAAMGMAVGAGNIWRFPRLAGQYGGSFLIPWIIFLFLWSIPLIIIEFSIGKKLRLGVIGAFSKGLGKKYAWLGWFVGMCTIGIMLYYSVVCGWSLKYMVTSLFSGDQSINYQEQWQSFTSNNAESIIYYLTAVLIGGTVIYRGISSGIEKATRILIPSLFALLILAALRALMLPNAFEGLNYFFRVRTEDLLNYKVWLEALSQSAWSTGAGWGLILTYATYVKQKEDIVSNSVMTAIGNNLASIVAGLAVIPTVFALSPGTDSAMKALQSGNQGLTFIYIPQLFEQMTGGKYFAVLFFLVLFIAALSSLLSMLELGVKLLMDYGKNRKKATIQVCSLTAVAALPSALSLSFFNNQDWVWGVGLLLSGLFFIFFVVKYGIKLFIKDFVPEIRISPYILKMLAGVMLLEFIFMFSWWFIQSVGWYPESWWDPFAEFTIGTCLFQWGLLIGAGLLFNHRLANIGTEGSWHN